MAVAKASNSVAAELAELKVALAEAVAEEDYSRAAQLRDHIRDIESSDPETVLRIELNRATTEERFEVSRALETTCRKPSTCAHWGLGPRGSQSISAAAGCVLALQQTVRPTCTCRMPPY